MRQILKYLAKLTLWRFEPRVIVVTGSVGKTSTIEAIYATLAHSSTGVVKRRLRISRSEFRRDLRVPLAILGDFKDEEVELLTGEGYRRFRKLRKEIFWLKLIFSSLASIFISKQSDYPEILVMEYDSSRPGNISYFLEMAKIHIGVITAFGQIPPHLEFWDEPEAIHKEKTKLIEHLSSSGFAVLNFDDEAVMKMRERTRARIITFGFNDGADVRITNFENRSEGGRPVGISFKLSYGGSFVPVILKSVFGRSKAYAAAAAACIGLSFDLNLVEISDALGAGYRPVSRRMNLLIGIKGAYIIDDTLSASPSSVHEALHTLGDLPGGRRIAVIGDMLELGKYAIEAHEAIGKLAARMVDILVTVGPRGKFIASGAREGGLGKDRIFSYDTASEAQRAVQDLIKAGDLILIKGSKEMGLERIVEEVRAMQ